MTYGESLLRAILDDPGSDVARLAYADRLEETGEGERVEFIRVQVEIARSDGCRVEGKEVNWRSPMRACRDVFPDPHEGKGWGPHCNPCHKVVRLRRRERELLAGRDYEWFVPRGVLSDWAQWRFRRGFVSSIDLTAADFLAHATTLFSAQPITEVRLTDREPWSNATFADWSYPCGWQESMTWWLREPYRLPPPLWETMKAPFVRDDIGYPDRVKCFPDLATAHAALSRACVAYGRELVGLPPLSEETKR